MKPYEYKNTIKHLRKITGEEKLKLGFALSEFAIDLLIESIKNENLKIKDKELWDEVKKIIWDTRKKAQKICSRNL